MVKVARQAAWSLSLGLHMALLAGIGHYKLVEEFQRPKESTTSITPIRFHTSLEKSRGRKSVAKKVSSATTQKKPKALASPTKVHHTKEASPSIQAKNMPSLPTKDKLSSDSYEPIRSVGVRKETLTYARAISDLVKKKVYFPNDYEGSRGSKKLLAKILIGPEGIREVSVVESSGAETLDLYTIKAIKEIGPLPPWPKLVGQTLITLKIPIFYKQNS